MDIDRIKKDEDLNQVTDLTKGKNGKKRVQTYDLLDDIYGGTRSFQEELGEKILNLVVRDCGIEELISGKEEFFLYFGKVFSDDVFYKERMEYFINYFLLDRPLSGTSETPFDKYYKEAFLLQTEENQKKWSGFYQWIHSVWMVERVDRTTLFVKDLINDQLQAVDLKDERSFFGIKRKDVFQGVVLFFSNFCVIKNGIIIHPSCVSGVVNQYIKNGIEAKKEQKLSKLDQIKMLGKLSNCSLQATRSKTLDPRVVYSKLI